MKPAIGTGREAKNGDAHDLLLRSNAAKVKQDCMRRICTEADLAAAVDELIRIEPRFGKVVERHGLPPLRLVPQGLESLLRIVTDQLISLQAGAAIWKRLAERLSPFDPNLILSHSESDLKGLGLSGAKARTFLAAAEVARLGGFDPSRIDSLDDQALISMLTSIRGVGPWTAEIYLLTAAGHADSWPTGDVALQAAVHDLLGLQERPAAKVMIIIAAPWQPYRSAAARLLWSHYRGLKGMRQAIM